MSQRYVPRWIAGVVLMALTSMGLAQPSRERGYPVLSSFLPPTYHAYAQNWDVVQDARGVLYVANSAGVLEYDGATWRLLPVANLSGARSLTMDTAGTLYVGAVGDFGILRPDSVGTLGFYSLAPFLPKQVESFQDVWRCFATRREVLFQTRNYLFILKPTQPNQIEVISTETYFDIAFQAGERLFVREEGKGLLEWENGRLVPVPGGVRFASERIFTILPYHPDSATHELLIGTRDEGLLRYNGQAFSKFATEADAYLKITKLYCGAVQRDGTLVLGTLGGGVVALDARGHLLEAANKLLGLPDETVYQVFQDRQGAVWLALNNGLARLELPAPLTILDDRLGLRGAVTSLTRYEGKLYVATQQGLFQLGTYLFRGFFKEIPEFSGQCWQLLGTPWGLLVATQAGVFQYTAGKRGGIAAVQPFHAVALLRSGLDSNRVYVGLYDGLASLYWNGRVWLDEGRVEGITTEVRSLVETPEGQLWLGQGNGVLCIKDVRKLHSSPTLVQLGIAEGLPPGRVVVYSALYKAHFRTTLNGSYRYDPGNNRFVPEVELAKSFADSLKSFEYITQYGEQQLWVALRSGKYFASLRPDHNYALKEATALRQLAAENYNVEYLEPKGLMWLGGYGGLVRYDPTIVPLARPPFVALIRQVQLGDSLLFGGSFWGAAGHASTLPPPGYKLRLPYTTLPLRIDYAAPDFDAAAGLEYQVYLEGLDNEWSSWSTEAHREFSRLPEGSYTLRVRARNAFGQLSQPTSLRFTMAEPWYRAWWAFLLYAVGGALGLYGLIRWRVRALEKEKQVLEERVAQRTEEVVAQKSELERAYDEIIHKNTHLNAANQEIEEKNQNIRDSLQYARRIQQAQLLPIAELHAALPEAFILLKPRDIVSGDFYWFAQLEANLLLAAVDCTGHGVPGAFLTLIGNTLLNQLVVEHAIIEPAALLDALDTQVRSALHPHGGTDVATQDGMEVGLCKIDKVNRTLSFAGAGRPLFYVHGRELKELPGDKASIGGQQPAEGFQQVVLAYTPGDIFYLTSDGFADQFGGPNGRKFMHSKFKDLLASLLHLPLQEQAALLESTLTDWQTNHEQTDDILVIGVRL